jgi:NAD kinase
MKPKFVLVTRKTRLQELVERFNTLDQARFYIEQLGQSFEDYVDEHETFKSALNHTEALLSQHGRLQRLDRAFLSNFLFSDDCIVFCLGQDGLVANTLKYTLDIPVVGVNPDQSRIDGKLLSFKPEDLAHLIPNILMNEINAKSITMAKAQLTNGQSLLAVNDLFIGPKTHTTASYSIEHYSKKETQLSSGVIVSTGMGSTGWMKSIIEGANSISNHHCAYKALDWSEQKLQFAVREPFAPTRKYALTKGVIKKNDSLNINSLMPEHGVIFSDGIEQDYIEFNSGLLATIGVAEQTARIVV